MCRVCMCRVRMGRVCYVPSLLWAEFVMCRVDPTPVRSLIARTQSLKSSFSRFICLKLVRYSQHHLKSVFLNLFFPFVWEKSTLLSFVFFFFFYRFFAFFSK